MDAALAFTPGERFRYSNAGFIVLGAIIVLGSSDSWWMSAIAFLAVVFGAANVVGGYAVTDRMLKMFRQRTPAATTEQTR